MGAIPTLSQEGLHQPHATRGWALRPNDTIIKDGKTYTTNSQGFRSLYEFNFEPTKYEVVIVGDSFTFGDEIDDSVTWPNLLQEMDANLNVFNMAGSGYGVDQMNITLSEEIAKYHPKLVIAAFIDNDLHRSMLYFRDYKKPRYIINDDHLVLTNTPIGGVEEVFNEISQEKKDHYSPIQIINVFHAIKRKFGAGRYIEEPRRLDRRGGCDTGCFRINEKLFENMAAIAKQNNADFLLIYLPYGQEIIDREFQGYGEFFFNNYKKRHKHNFLNLRKNFLNASFAKSYVHYKESENRLVSKLVYEKIQELPSWKDFETK